MKLDCGPGDGSETQRGLSWHNYFAWVPTPVGPHDCRWLETIERKFEWRGASGVFYDPTYRAKPGKDRA